MEARSYTAGSGQRNLITQASGSAGSEDFFAVAGTGTSVSEALMVESEANGNGAASPSPASVSSILRFFSADSEESAAPEVSTTVSSSLMIGSSRNVNTTHDAVKVAMALCDERWSRWSLPKKKWWSHPVGGRWSVVGGRGSRGNHIRVFALVKKYDNFTNSRNVFAQPKKYIICMCLQLFALLIFYGRIYICTNRYRSSSQPIIIYIYQPIS